MIAMLLVSFFFLVEGPNFLYGNKREKECLESLETVALINNTMREFEEVKYQFRFEST